MWQFSPVKTVIHTVARIIKGTKKGEHLQEFNFHFSKLIQAVTNEDPSQIMDPLKLSYRHRNDSIQSSVLIQYKAYT